MHCIVLVAGQKHQNEVLLRPKNEVCEGYVFTGVCLSTGGCLPHCMLGYTPGPEADTPQKQTPPAVHARRYGQQAGGTHLLECILIAYAFSSQ